jgi:hypothetical protein
MENEEAKKIAKGFAEGEKERIEKQRKQKEEGKKETVF